MTVRTSNPRFFTVLPPRPIERLGWEVKIYDVDNPNTYLGYVVNWRGLHFTKELNGLGNGGVQIRLDDPVLQEPLPVGVFSAGVLEEANIFRIFWDGIEQFAFIHDQDREPEITLDEQGGMWIEINGEGTGSMLNRIAVFPKHWEGFGGTYDPADKNHVWVDKSYAEMWLDLFEAAEARGAADDIGTSFTAAKDSHEQDWTFTANVNLPPGGTMLDLLQRWGEVAFDWYVDTDLTVHMWQEFGHHREEEIVFWAGGDIRQTEKNSDRREIKNVVVVEASDGSTASAVDAASLARWRRREVYLSAGEADDVTTAQAYANAALKVAKDEAVERTLTVAPDWPDRRCFTDYDIGDYVSLVAGNEEHPETWTEPEAVRILAISIAVSDENADATAELTIQSKFQAALVRMYRKLQQLAIKREGTAGNIATPVESGSKADLSQQQAEIDALEAQVAALTFDDLQDVDVLAPNDGDTVAWDDISGLWVAVPPGGVPTMPWAVPILMYWSNVWTNMPAALTDYDARLRAFADLTNMEEVRFQCAVGVAGAATAFLRLQYTTDLTGATGWTTLVSNSIAAVGFVLGSWTALPAGAKGPVLLRFAGEGGNAAADPNFGSVMAHFRG